MKELQAIAQEQKLNLGFEKKKSPDKKWLVLAIGALDPKHEIFFKNYYYKKSEHTKKS